MSKTGVENSNHEVVDSKKEHKLLRKGLAVALAGAVALGAAGCSGDKVSATTPEINPSTTTESVAEPAETEIVVNPTEEYGASMEIYENMSVEEFEALPISERLKYSQFLMDKTNSGRYYEIFYSEGSPGEPYKLDLIEDSIDMSDQELFESFSRKLQLAFLQSEPTEEIKIPINKTNSIKLLDGAFYDVGNNSVVTGVYFGLLEDINDGPSYIRAMNPNQPSIPDSVTTNNEGVSNLEDGVSVKYRDISGQFEDKEIYYRFVYYNFVNYDGQNKSTWLLDAVAGSQEDLINLSDIK